MYDHLCFGVLHVNGLRSCLFSVVIFFSFFFLNMIYDKLMFGIIKRIL